MCTQVAILIENIGVAARLCYTTRSSNNTCTVKCTHYTALYTYNCTVTFFVLLYYLLTII